SRERFLGRSVDELFTEESGVALKAALAGKRQPDVAQYLDLKTRAGDVVTAAFTVFGAGRVGNTDYRILALEDVTARLHAEEQLRIAATAFESHGAIAVADEARLLLEVNEAFTELTQYARVEAVGEGPEMLRSARHSAHFYRDIWDEVDEFGRWEGEVWTRRRNGSEFPAWQTITAVYDDQGQLTHYVINLIDITDRVRAEREIERLAYFDPLTGLANRRYLLDRLDSAIAAARRRTVHGALLFIDLDHFKQINDSMGHSIGDGVLMQVAERLQRLIRQEDVVCRLGGDEFVVLLGDTGPTLKASRAHVQKVAEKIGEVLSRPYVVDRQEFHITPTIGIASFPEGGDTPADLLKEADSAMYQGKTEGRNTWRFYDPAMAARATERMELENDLRGAVERDELELHFQPQIRAGVGIIGAEALLRWKHPERGYVSPEKFIAIAEDSTLIQDLGRWVVEHAMATAAAWIDDDLAFIDHLAINLSPRQFRSADFVAELEQMRADAGVPAHFIVLELTERAVIDDIDGTIAKMNQLRALGFRFSVDDFGIGYSSLAYLRRLPLDQLKIDRAFVLDVVDDANAGVIAETIIAMGHQLGLETIAEGIETEAQRDFLVARGCDEFQGYLYCRPLPDGDFRAFCAAYRAETATAG
ncbi:MAG: putative bifunctional diguanylate cyclase/phosphodiesterase, partial [Gammaproteobacteria bacterium]